MRHAALHHSTPFYRSGNEAQRATPRKGQDQAPAPPAPNAASLMGHQEPRGHGADKQLSLIEEKENTQVNQTEEGQREKSPRSCTSPFLPSHLRPSGSIQPGGIPQELSLLKHLQGWEAYSLPESPALDQKVQPGFPGCSSVPWLRGQNSSKAEAPQGQGGR